MGDQYITDLAEKLSTFLEENNLPDGYDVTIIVTGPDEEWKMHGTRETQEANQWH